MVFQKLSFQFIAFYSYGVNVLILSLSFVALSIELKSDVSDIRITANFRYTYFQG